MPSGLVAAESQIEDDVSRERRRRSASRGAVVRVERMVVRAPDCEEREREEPSRELARASERLEDCRDVERWRLEALPPSAAYESRLETVTLLAELPREPEPS